MTPVRVLLVTASPDRGGAETVVLQLLAGLDRRAVDPAVVTLAAGSFQDEIAAAGWPVFDAGTVARMRNLGRSVRVIARLASRIREGRIDVVHSHGTQAHIIGGLAAWWAGVPAIHHVHDLYADSRTTDAVLQHFALRVPAAAIVAVSHSARARLLASGAPWNRVKVVHNGVSLDQTPPAFARVSGRPAVVWCGRLQRWKGAHVFLDAARIVRDSHPDARFWIVGGTLFGKEPEYAAELKERAAGLGIADAVTFTGHVPDARPYLAAADVVVHCSIDPEPFGLVIAEALAEGKPVVAFDEGGPAEMVESGRSGRLVAPGSTEALAGATSDLLDRPDLRARIAEGALARARHFGLDAMLRRMHFVYDEVLAGRAP
jgi:glycosyltransferase involved in cell wall biosynthesis